MRPPKFNTSPLKNGATAGRSGFVWGGPTYQGKTCGFLTLRFGHCESKKLDWSFLANKSKIIEFLRCFTNFLRKNIERTSFLPKIPPETIPSQKGGSSPWAIRRNPTSRRARLAFPGTTSGAEASASRLRRRRGAARGGAGSAWRGRNGRPAKIGRWEHPGRLVTAICFGICRWILVSSAWKRIPSLKLTASFAPEK